MAKQSQRSLRTNELVRAASKTNTVPSTITSEKVVCLETFAQRLTKLCQTCQEHTQKAKETPAGFRWVQVLSGRYPPKKAPPKLKLTKWQIFLTPPNNSDITTGLIFRISCSPHFPHASFIHSLNSVKSIRFRSYPTWPQGVAKSQLCNSLGTSVRAS